MNKLSLLKTAGKTAIVLGTLWMISCKKEDTNPPVENETEVFTDVKLIFTNTLNPNDVVEARAQDPDGTGIQELQILDGIVLGIDKTYRLSYEIRNNLETPGEDLGAEISEENAEHQFFFSFTNDIFSSPSGNGNIDNASDPINYLDQDANGNNVGLSSEWTTPSTPVSSGTFNVRLQHQPDVKTSTSGANDGDTDFDLTFTLTIQ